MYYSKKLNDLWSLYKFGNQYKLVYYKTFVNNKGFESNKKHKTKSCSSERFEESVSRTRAKIFEIAACNDFEYFVTLTLNKEKRDRFDLHGFSKDFAQFVRDENKKRCENEKIKYLLIPEQHQDGAWHMHGLFMGLNKNDFVKNEHGYLDWVAYSKRFGFFSCSKIKSRLACSKYITKYVSKSIDKATPLECGAHSFYASKGLKRKEVVFYREVCNNFIVNQNNFDFENEYVKIKWLSLDEVDEIKHLVL
jgi:hypothetical protein